MVAVDDALEKALLEAGAIHPRGAGKLEHSPNDQIMLSRYHSAYVSFVKPQDVKVGDKFLTARVGEEIEHPATGKKVGYMVTYSGELEVTAVGKDNTYFTPSVAPTWRARVPA